MKSVGEGRSKSRGVTEAYTLETKPSQDYTFYSIAKVRELLTSKASTGERTKPVPTRRGIPGVLKPASIYIAISHGI